MAAATGEIFGKGHRRVLTVRVSLVFFIHWLSSRLAGFRELYPDVNLLVTSNIWEGETDVEADMEIRHGHGKWAGLKSERLTWDTLFPVCAPFLPSSDLPLRIPNDLARHDLLHVLGYEEGWVYWLKKVGADHVDASQGMQFDTLISALALLQKSERFAVD